MSRHSAATAASFKVNTKSVSRMRGISDADLLGHGLRFHTENPKGATPYDEGYTEQASASAANNNKGPSVY